MSFTAKYRERSRSPVDKAGRKRDSDVNNSGMNHSLLAMSQGMNSSNLNMTQGMNSSGMSMPQGMNMNQLHMMNNMYQQGNMLMGAMFPNMMVQTPVMGSMPTAGGMMPTAGGMMQTSGLDLMQTGGMDMMNQSNMDMMNQSNMDIMSQSNMDMSSMTSQTAQPSAVPTMEVNVMSGMMMDPAMMGMNMYPNMGANVETVTNSGMPRPELKEIVLKNVTLTPPTPDRPLPPRRIRPPGCRTIFVGGLPEKIRESMVRDIFERYGRIMTLRLSKKNFCHIRFDRESCVDEAIWLSGYNIKITEKSKDDKDETKDENKDGHAYSGWLHVDFALSRDDQNEYERRQRQALRAQEAEMQKIQQQQQQQMSTHHSARKAMSPPTTRKSRFRSPSPPRTIPFSPATATQVAEKLKTEDQFSNVLPTLLTWLERGECSKKYSNQFYSMIQVANSQIRRLFNEKMQAEDEFQEYKERMKVNISKIIEQLEQVGKVFTAATHQRVWDHFTKPQRKNIETWKLMAQEFTNLKEEFMEKFGDEETVAPPKPIIDNDELMQIKRENESLQFQLEAYKNEVDVIKADAQRDMEKFKAQYIASQALKLSRDHPPLPNKPLERPPPPPPLPGDFKFSVDPKCGEAKLIGVMAAFLQVHPQGASLDYLVSYVRALHPSVSHANVHQVLQKHTDAFQCVTTGVGANIDNRWQFTGFTDRD